MFNRRNVAAAVALGAFSIGSPLLSQEQTGKAGASDTGCPTPAEAASSIVTSRALALFSPRAQVALADAIIRNWRAAEDAEINTPLRIQHFLTQIATETGGFRRIDENLDYSAARLRTVFPRRVSPEQAERLAHHPRAIANHVYGGRLGNVKADDGWRYRGSGFIQLTGRANFRERAKFLGSGDLPLEDNPDLARTPTPGFLAAVSYWKKREINSVADRDDLVAVRLRVNGGTTGLPAARIWLARARRIFKSGRTESTEAFMPDAEEMFAVQLRLQEAKGLTSEVRESLNEEIARDPAELTESLEQFQLEEGIPETGLYDEDTLYEMTELGSQDPDPSDGSSTR